MVDPAPKQAWLIGGAGRSGKTTLANALQTHSRLIAGFPLEGVFHVYLQRRFPFFRHQRHRVLSEYMNRPRYMDAGRTRVERPHEHFRAKIDALAAQLPDRIDHPIRLFAWLLDQYAAERGRQGWAVFDLLPELRFATYRMLIPGVKLAVMRRAPQEAIAEALFWRTYPAPPPDRRRRFQNMLFQWCLSRRVSEMHEARYPDEVQTFSFNALTEGDLRAHSRLAKTFDMDIDEAQRMFDFSAPFAYRAGEGFRGPDGQIHALLTDSELADIEHAAAGGFVRKDLAALLALAPRMPVAARGVGDFLLYPGTISVRRVNAMRQQAADLAAGLRLALAARA